MKFEHSEEPNFLQFLRSDAAAYLWSDSEDIQIISNLYQIKVKVIKLQSDCSEDPTVYWIGPDSDLDAFKILPKGKVPDMVLINYDQNHYNLVISKDSELAKTGILSEQLKVSLKSKQEPPMEDGVDKMDVTEQITSEQRCTLLEIENKKNQHIIQMLSRKILLLENVLKNKPNNETSSKDDEKLDEVSILVNKTKGHSRETPQFQSQPKININQLANKQFQHENILLSLECVHCPSKFALKSEFNYHMKIEHTKKEEQFDCDDCTFQGYSKSEIDNHVKVTNHRYMNKVSSTDGGNYYICHSCGETFKTKVSLMQHRRTSHIDIIKKCRYFLLDNCAYNDRTCWYLHNKSNITLNQVKPSLKSPEIPFPFTCYFCEQKFTSKPEFMLHKKTIHGQTVPQCTEQKQGKCNFTAAKCWYKHEEISFLFDSKIEPQMSQQQNFQKVMRDRLPPDNKDPSDMRRILNLIEQVMLKVDKLESASQKSQ